MTTSGESPQSAVSEDGRKGAARLLVLRLSALGDVIHTMPAVVALRAARPDLEVAWCVEAPYAEMVQKVARVSRVVPVATRRWRRHPLAGETRADLVARVREMREAARSAASIDFQGLVKSAIFGWLSGAALRYGFARDSVREPAALLFINRPVRIDRSLHVVEWNMQLARAFEASIDAKPPAVDYSPFLSERPDLRSARNRIVFLPGAGRPSKMWPVGSFRKLARRLVSRGERPLVVWGPGEEGLATAVAAGGDADLAPPTDLRQLAWVLQHSRLVIGGDTGPLHLAAAVGTAVIGLFGPTNPARNGPYGQIEHCIERYTTSTKMEAIAVDEVMGRIGEVLP